MSWSTGATPPKPLSPDTQLVAAKHNNDVNQVMLAWRTAAEQLEQCKLAEQVYRKAVFEMKFPDAKEGTQRVELGNGYYLKAVYPLNYNLSKDNTEAAQDAIGKLSPKADVIADRLVRWTPELSVKEYRLLMADTTEEGKQIQTLLSTVLTITPGMPRLEIEEPKA